MKNFVCGVGCGVLFPYAPRSACKLNSFIMPIKIDPVLEGLTIPKGITTLNKGAVGEVKSFTQQSLLSTEKAVELANLKRSAMDQIPSTWQTGQVVRASKASGLPEGLYALKFVCTKASGPDTKADPAEWGVCADSTFFGLVPETPITIKGYKSANKAEDLVISKETLQLA